MAFFPLVIGFSYLLSTEAYFSLWFFYLVFKVQSMGDCANALLWTVIGFATGTGYTLLPG